ncbi:galactose oxidase [Oxalobacteraceae bacterium GrIS 1.11]
MKKTEISMAVAGSLLVCSGLVQAAVPPGLPLSGWMYDIQNVSSERCANAPANSGASNSPAVEAYCNGATEQRWQLNYLQNNIYSLKSGGTDNTCLTVEATSSNGAGLTQGSAIVRATCDASLDRQMWSLKAGVAGGFTLTSQRSQMCLSGGNGNGALLQYPCGSGATQEFLINQYAHAPTDAGSAGQWSAVHPTSDQSVLPAAAALLPNGKVLYWSGTGNHAFHGTGTLTFTGLLDLGYGSAAYGTPGVLTSIHEETVDNGFEMFCPGTAMTEDGRVFIAGGGGSQTNDSQGVNYRAKVASYNFNVAAGNSGWKREAPMGTARWYNATITTPDGALFTTGGDGSTGTWERLVHGDLWSPVTQSWTYLSGTNQPDGIPLADGNSGDFGQARAQYYRKSVNTPSGRLLEVVPNPSMYWHDVKGKDGSGNITGTTTFAAKRPASGTRANGEKFDEYNQGMIVAQYAYDRALLAGGSYAFGDEDPTAIVSHKPASKKAYEINLNDASTTVVPDMRLARYQANSVVMPDGNVMVIGGGSISALFANESAILAPEIYNRVSKTWSDMAPMATPRMYHSVALLLPDATVWAAGGGLCNDCTVNHPDYEIFSPPYLFNGNQRAARPLISSAPGSALYGQKFPVTASAGLTRFSLVRLSSVTHSTNSDQRWLELVAKEDSSGNYTLTAPADANKAVPGYYMLFALNAAGTPSIAKIMKFAAK